MSGLAAHQATALDELVEWWEDLHDCSTGSQLACLVVPAGWGSTTVLDALAGCVMADDRRLGAVLRVPGGDAPEGLALQVAWLHELLERERFLGSLPGQLGLDRAEGVVEAGVSALGLVGLLTGVPELVAGLPATLALRFVASRRDRSTGGQLAQATRMAHAVASYSTSLPVALLIDDAERLDPALVEGLVFTVLDRTSSNVLVVVVVDSEAPLLARFRPRDRYGPRWERIGWVDADSSMDESVRRRLIEATAQDWPPACVDRLASGTSTFSEIWTVLSVPAAADVASLARPDDQRVVVDRLVSQVVDPGVPPPAARVVAWAGGLLHELQLAAAVAVLQDPYSGEGEPGADAWLVRLGQGVRLAHRGLRARAERSASALSRSQRRAMASAVTAVAKQFCEGTGPPTSRVDRICALRPVLHLAEVAELDTGPDMGELLARLSGELEALGDTVGAFEVAEKALAIIDRVDPATETIRSIVAARLLRLAWVCGHDAAERAAAVADAIGDGAVIGLEANAWRAITLLDRPATRPAGAELVDGLALELSQTQRSLGEAANHWRLLLAFHAGRAGYLGLTESLLAALLEPPHEDEADRDMAYQVLAAVSGEGIADDRIYRQALYAIYEQLGDGVDPSERLGVVDALAYVNHRLGDWAQALRFGEEVLEVRLTLFDPDHPDTLATRNNVAFWTGETGDPRRARELFEALLRDQVRVLGPNHPGTLATRNNVAGWTGRTGDPRRARELFEALLPDQVRVLGPDHPDTLTTRNNVAAWTGGTGDARRARELFEALLPDQVRVLGPDHPDTLATRSNVAGWTGETGDARRARELFEALLPDRVRVLGPDHPDTLATRSHVAFWTGRTGDARRARELFEALLPDRIRVLGPDHPDTLTTRSNVASWTGRTGDARRARELFEALLPDQIRVLGPDHSDTLATAEEIERLLE